MKHYVILVWDLDNADFPRKLIGPFASRLQAKRAVADLEKLDKGRPDHKCVYIASTTIHRMETMEEVGAKKGTGRTTNPVP